MNYDAWKTTEPDPDQWSEDPDREDTDDRDDRDDDDRDDDDNAAYGWGVAPPTWGAVIAFSLVVAPAAAYLLLGAAGFWDGVGR